MKHVSNILAVALVAIVIAWVLDLFRYVGLVIYSEQFLAAALALALPLTFIFVPAGPGKDRAEGAGPPWFDVLAACAGFLCCAFIAFVFPDYSNLVYSPNALGMAIAVIVCLLLLEGLRRTTGYGMTLVTLSIIALALLGQFLPGTLQGRAVPLDRLTFFLLWDASAIFGQAMTIVVTLVVAFIVFGNALFLSGGSSFLTDLAISLMGRFRGGSAKIAILASSLFGSISGSVVANVVTTGVVTIPLMRNGGFRRDQAGAVEAVASTGGQLMPPVMGVAAFLMAEFLQVPYTSVVLAAIVPSILYYLAFFVQVDLQAAKMEIKPVPKAEIPNAWTVLREGWHFLLPFVVLVYTLFGLNMQPEQSALIATAFVVVGGFVKGYKGSRLRPSDLLRILSLSGVSVLDLFMIGAAAGVVMAVLSYSGLGFGLSLSLVNLSGGNVFVLLVLAGFASIILGMGMPTPGVYILLATLVAPSLIEMGVSPMAAHMFIMYYGMLSMITPPVAIGAFAAGNIAGASGMKTALTSCIFGWTAFVVPFLFVFSNTLLMTGDPVHIVIDALAAFVGVTLVTVGIVGFGLRLLGTVYRIIFALCGICLVLPMSIFPAAAWFNVAGGLVAATFVGLEIVRYLSLRPAASSLDGAPSEQTSSPQTTVKIP